MPINTKRLVSFITSTIFIVAVIGFSAFAAPIATPKTFSVVKNTALEGAVLEGVAADGGALTFAIATPPENGEILSLNSETGAFSYMPDEDFVGVDSFDFTVSEDDETSNPSTVTLNVAEATGPTTSPEPTDDGSGATASPEPTDDGGEPTPAPPQTLYRDLVDHWANYPAGYLADLGIVIGEKIGNHRYFYPEKLMNRAEYVIFLVNAMGFHEMDSVAQAVQFDDKDNIPSWVHDEARIAKAKEIINGVAIGGGKIHFEPYAVITRVEAVRMLANAAAPAAESTEELTFADAGDIPDWAEQSVKDMVGWGLIEGDEDNKFNPYDQITRAEAAKMIYKLYEFNQLPDDTTLR